MVVAEVKTQPPLKPVAAVVVVLAELARQGRKAEGRNSEGIQSFKGRLKATVLLAGVQEAQAKGRTMATMASMAAAEVQGQLNQTVLMAEVHYLAQGAVVLVVMMLGRPLVVEVEPGVLILRAEGAQ